MKRQFFACIALLLVCLVGNACALEKTILLPDSLESIGTRAFQGDRTFTRVVLPHGMHTIGEAAFADSGVKELNFPESLITVEVDAFLNCGHVEVTTSGPNGRMQAEELIGQGYDIGIYGAAMTFGTDAYITLRAAADQKIVRTFVAPESARYTLRTGENIVIMRLNAKGETIREETGSLSFDVRAGSVVTLGFRFLSSMEKGDFTVTCQTEESRMASVGYEPMLTMRGIMEKQYEENDLTQLSYGEYLSPSLYVFNEGPYKNAGIVTAELDGRRIKVDTFSLKKNEHVFFSLGEKDARRAETPGEHHISWIVDAGDPEEVTSMSWVVRGSRGIPDDALQVALGTTQVTLSSQKGNCFVFTPAKDGVYHFQTSNPPFDSVLTIFDAESGEVLTESDDDAEDDFDTSLLLNAGQTVILNIWAYDLTHAVTLPLIISNGGMQNVSCTVGLYQCDYMSSSYLDRGDLGHESLIYGPAVLGMLEDDQYISPILTIQNKSAAALPVNLTAIVDGWETLHYETDLIDPKGSFCAYISNTSARDYEVEGHHTIEWSLNGVSIASFEWDVAGNRKEPRYVSSHILLMELGYSSVTLTGMYPAAASFTAPYSGVYAFFTDAGDTYGYLFDENMNLLDTDDDSNGVDFAITRYLEKGEKVIVEAMFLNEFAVVSSNIHVQYLATRPKPTPELHLGANPMGVTVATGGPKEVDGYFVAPYTGTFRFAANGENSMASIRGTLYDQYWNELSSDENYGYSTKHFTITYALQEGETVFLTAEAISRTDMDNVVTITGSR